jgi:hypothetical protein
VIFDYKFINTDELVLRIPEGLQIEYLPGAVRLDEPFGLFESTYQVEEDRITHKRTFVRRKLTIPVDQYRRLKDFYDLTAAEDNRRVILKKVSGSDKIKE